MILRAYVDESEPDQRYDPGCYLLTTLSSHGVAEVLLESRQRKQDESDLRVVDVLRAERSLSHQTRVAHLAGPGEPLLWIADVLGGVVGAHRRGQSSYFDCFDNRIRIIDA